MAKFGLPIAALILLGTLAVAAPARTDKHPSGDTRTRIEAALQDRGFESWGEIERSDDGRACGTGASTSCACPPTTCTRSRATWATSSQRPGRVPLGRRRA